MNARASDLPRGNTGFESVAFGIGDHCKDFLKESLNMRMSVLFFYGKRDWMVGPNHYAQVYFPNMVVREMNMGHLSPSPFIGDGPNELARALRHFMKTSGL